MTLAASLGKKDPAIITKTWRGNFKQFVDALLKDVHDSRDKAAPGWVCGAEFRPEYRHSENFVARHLLSMDYDHINPADVDAVLSDLRGIAYLAHTTWSHVPSNPRLRVWIPLSRAVSFDEFQAISRKQAAALGGIELAARESHTPAQFMYRPASQKGTPFQHWEDTTSPYLDADKVLAEYTDWTDRKRWPHRAEGDSCHDPEVICSPLEKPGVVGDFCRAFTISAAIERFGLPYRPGSTDGRWTYTAGSRADGAVSYDDDTKLHSHHDTDPARGQSNAYDLVRLHRFGARDAFDGDLPLNERASSRAMAQFAAEQPELRAARFAEAGFADLDAGTDDLAEKPAHPIPEPIPEGTSKASDLENCRRIQRIYGEDLLSVGEAFYVWSGTHWVKDKAPVDRLIATLSQIVDKEARQLLAAGHEEQAKALFKWAAACCSATTMSACARLLPSFLKKEADTLNADPGLLNCRSGTIDLRTGQVRPHRSGDFITACAPTLFNPSARAPRFAQFLGEIFKSQTDLVGFAKRWFGYCITGETREHALVFHVGQGGNGKGKLIEALQHVVGPGYAGPAPRQLLSAKPNGASPEIAGLFGRRMMTLQESNQDEAFDEALLKNLTGGDRLSARHLYEGYFEFNPTHKLQLFTNSEPKISGMDRGIWRRLFFLEYQVLYGRPEEIAAGIANELQDDALSVKLAAEAEGILAWLVEGAQEWYTRGLDPPASVLRMTRAYKERQDVVGTFLQERTTRDPSGRVPLNRGPGSLYEAYRGWAGRMGLGQLSCRRFAKGMRAAAPYAKPLEWTEKGAHFKGFEGLRLAEEAFL